MVARHTIVFPAVQKPPGVASGRCSGARGGLGRLYQFVDHPGYSAAHRHPRICAGIQSRSSRKKTPRTGQILGVGAAQRQLAKNQTGRSGRRRLHPLVGGRYDPGRLPFVRVQGPARQRSDADRRVISRRKRSPRGSGRRRNAAKTPGLVSRYEYRERHGKSLGGQRGGEDRAGRNHARNVGG